MKKYLLYYYSNVDFHISNSAKLYLIKENNLLPLKDYYLPTDTFSLYEDLSNIIKNNNQIVLSGILEKTDICYITLYLKRYCGRKNISFNNTSIKYQSITIKNNKKSR